MMAYKAGLQLKVIVLLSCLACVSQEAIAEQAMTTDGRFNTRCYLDSKGKERCRLSIIQLIAEPEKFHGRAVQIVGIFAASNSDIRLYLDGESFKNKNKLNSLKLNLDVVEARRNAAANGRRVLVEGEFDALGGDDGYTSGALKTIIRVDPFVPN